MALETVQSRDGAAIAYERSGSGPALVVVHGSLSDASSWQLVRSVLEQQFTVYAVNRRGREGSAPMVRFDLEEEFADIAAVVDTIAEPVHLFGHSFGAHSALGAMLLADNVRSLGLYEPPPPGPQASGDIHIRLRKLLEDGNVDEVISTFIRLEMEAPDELVEGMKQSPMWPTFVSHAQTLVEEVDALVRYQFDPQRFAHLEQPVLLLIGDQSPPPAHEATHRLRPVLRNASVVELKGQAHAAHATAPDLLSKEILTFLDAIEEERI